MISRIRQWQPAYWKLCGLFSMVLFTLLVGCGDSNPPVVGKWVKVTDPGSGLIMDPILGLPFGEVIEFFPDGTVSIRSQAAKYSWPDNSHLKIEYIAGIGNVYEAVVSGDQLTLKGASDAGTTILKHRKTDQSGNVILLDEETTATAVVARATDVAAAEAERAAATGTAEAVIAQVTVTAQAAIAVATADAQTVREANLADISMISPSEGWAVGAYQSRPLILHYVDGKWGVVRDAALVDLTNRGGYQALSTVHMISANEGWAFGAATQHYIGGEWTDASSPDLVGINDAHMLSADDGWAVGIGGDITHYNGSKWEKVFNQPDTILTGIYMLSAKEGWAVGDRGTILYYTGDQWKPVSSPTTEWVWSVYMLSSNDGWAVSSQRTYGSVPDPGIVYRYNGTKWETVHTRIRASLNKIYMVSTNEGWATGVDNWGQNSTDPGVLLHYSGGTWEKEDIPTKNRLSSLYMVSSNEGWAVGEGTILHYQNGVWSNYNP